MNPIVTARRIDIAEATGTAILRYGVALLLLFIGALKFFAWEAQGIQPLVSNSPLMSWLYSIFSVQGVSNLIGTTEIITGLLIAARPFAPALSAVGSAFAVVIFATTLSFLFTTPGAMSPMNPWWGFLVKDVVLLGASVYAAAEAARAATANAGATIRHGTPAQAQIN